MGKRIKAHFYSEDKYVRVDGCTRLLSDAAGCLYSSGQYATKLKAEDLPAWYIPGYYYKRHGFMCAKGVKHLLYKPNMVFNHMFKDDILFISYGEPMELVEEKDCIIKHMWADHYDEFVSGGDIVAFIRAVDKYSPECDTTLIKQQIEMKRLWLKEHFPIDYEMQVRNDKPFFPVGESKNG